MVYVFPWRFFLFFFNKFFHSLRERSLIMGGGGELHNEKGRRGSQVLRFHKGGGGGHTEGGAKK